MIKLSRPPRIISETGLYHIVFRGINRQNLFEESADYEKMLEIITEEKANEKFEIYAYCLMTNHVHLFIKEKQAGDIKRIMHKILTRYVVWYNYKYERSGSLIGNRYKSEPIEDEEYFFTLLRYIHQNPTKAHVVEEIKKYKWSSYQEYITEGTGVVDKDFVLSMLSINKEKAIMEFQEYHKTVEEYDFSISNTKRLTDEQLRRKLKRITKGIQAHEITQMSKRDRNGILSILRSAGFTIGQLERLTGISRGIITRCKNVQK